MPKLKEKVVVENGANHENIITIPLGNLIRNVSHFKVTKAVAEIKVNEEMGSVGGFNVMHNETLIDYVMHKSANNFICVDITDELIDFVNAKPAQQNFVLEINPDNTQPQVSETNMGLNQNVAISEHYFLLDATSSCCQIEYEEVQLQKENEIQQEISALRAGSGKLNLQNGNLQFAHSDVASVGKVLPFSVSHVYNSFNAGKQADEMLKFNTETITLPEYYCGKGFKLNLQQYLFREVDSKNSITNSGSVTSQNTTADKFTYFDANGNRQIFETKYYYKQDNGDKVYLKASEIKIDLDGNLTYDFVDDSKAENNKTKKVEKEITNSSNLQLVSEMPNFIGIEKINQDSEDVAKLKAEIKEIDETLSDIEKQLEINSDNLNLIGLNLQQSVKLRHMAALDVGQDLRKEEYNNRIKTAQTDAETAKNNYKNSFYEAYYKDVKPTDNTGMGESLRLKIAMDEANATLADVIDKYNNEELTTDDFETPYYEKCYTPDEYVKEVADYKLADFYTSYEIRNLTNAYQANSINNENEKLLFTKSKYTTIKEQKQHELLSLLKVTPVHYIIDGNGQVIGFGKAYNNDAEIENVFKILFVSDPYENAVYFNYNKENKLETVVDSANNCVKFEYKNNLLSSISADNGSITNFEYDANLYLTKIVYDNGECSSYGYNENGMLTHAIEPSGQGVLIEYSSENGKVSRVSEIFGASEISDSGKSNVAGTYNETSFVEGFDQNHNKTLTTTTKEVNAVLINGTNYAVNNWFTVAFYDCNNTKLCDNKGNIVNYVFDVCGNLTTVYENDFMSYDENNNLTLGMVNALSFGYSDNKKVFSVTPNNYACELLSNSEFQNVNESVGSEWYLGDDMRCGDDIVLLKGEVSTVKHSLSDCLNSVSQLIRPVNSNQIDVINNNKFASLILSGWAKANSAYVNRTRKSDLANESIEEISGINELENLMLNNLDVHKLGRRFELCIQINYEKTNADGGTEMFFSQQFASFDWLNTNWQFCMVPVKLDNSLNVKVLTINAIFDYSFNTGTAEFMNMSLKAGKYEVSTFNKEGLKLTNESSAENSLTTFEYNNNNQLVKSTKTENVPTFEIVNGVNTLTGITPKSYVSTCAYNTKGYLIKSMDYNGMVNENVFNDKGVCIKTLSYHISDPSSIFYSEKALNDKGHETGMLNELGENVATYEVNQNGNLEQITDTCGNSTAYGYKENNLVAVSGNAGGIENKNLLNHVFGLTTSMEHNGFCIKYKYNGFGNVSEINIAGNPYVAITTLTNGATTTFANGEKFETSLNNKGDVSAIKFTNAQGVSKIVLENAYDTKGNLIGITDNTALNAVNHVLTRNENGEVTNHTSAVNGVTTIVSSTINPLGQTTATTQQFGNQKVEYAYNYSGDLNRNLESIVLPNGLTETVSVDKLNRVKQINTGGVLSHNISYLKNGNHTTNMPSAIWYGTNGNVNESIKYSYNVNGNITKVAVNGQEQVRYCYDELNRLVREDNKVLNKSFVMLYDEGGNLLAKNEYNFSLGELSEPTLAVNCAYALNGWRDQLTSVQLGNEILAFAYDTLGNPTTYMGKTLEWSMARNLTKFHNVNFCYDAFGLRTTKMVNGVNTTYFYFNNQLVLEDNPSQTIVFEYGANGISGFTIKPKVDGIINEANIKHYIYRKNAQGDITHIFDNFGKLTTKYSYNAWGECKIEVPTETGFEDITFNPLYNNVGLKNPIRYRGYYFDTETGLYYLQSRYYNPQIGRFLNADNVSYLQPEAINGLNLYAYCGNNPVNCIDVNGNAWWNPFSWDWKKIGKVALGIFAVVATTALTVATAGLFTVAIGAGTALTGVMVGAAIGGFVAGGLELANQISTNGIDNISFGSIITETITGGLLGGFGALGLLGGVAKTVSLLGMAMTNGMNTLFRDLSNGINAGTSLYNMGVSIALGMILFGFTNIPNKNLPKMLSNSNLFGKYIYKLTTKLNLLMTLVWRGIRNLNKQGYQ